MNLKGRIAGLVAALLLPLSTGCFVSLPPDFMSSIILHPDTTCLELAQQLQLGAVRAASTPADIGLAYTPFNVVSANGAKLSAWFIPAQFNGALENNPLGTVVFTHGTDGSIACALPWGALAAQNRLHVVLFDYQGFGDSEGAANIATLLDDSEAVLDWVLSDPDPARQKVHLLGVSLGTGPAFGLAALRDRPQLQSLMVDGVFDPQEQVDGAVAAIGGLFPLVGDSARSEFKWLFDMRAGLPNIRVPILMITAELDSITPKTGADTMRMLLQRPLSNSWAFNGLGHIQPYFLLPDNYASLAVSFWRNPSVDSDPNLSQTDATVHVPQLAP